MNAQPNRVLIRENVRYVGVYVRRHNGLTAKNDVRNTVKFPENVGQAPFGSIPEREHSLYALLEHKSEKTGLSIGRNTYVSNGE
jgi:hypothetical protein